MAKCRGCGGDTRDYEGEPGWMHFECEIRRLKGMLWEEQAFTGQLQDEILELKAEIEPLSVPHGDKE